MGTAVEIGPHLRRLTAANGGRLTAAGTNSFLVGHGDVVVIDPGPDDDAHLNAILAETRDARIVGIALTHAHADHAGLAAKLHAATGAAPLDDSQLRDFGIETLPTPGHTSDHLAFRAGDVLLTGDHVFEVTSTMIDWPDGNLGAFLDTCRRLRELASLAFHPAHGPPLSDPLARLDWLISHRDERNATILAALDGGPLPFEELLAQVYGALPVTLHEAARRTLHAHLDHLAGTGHVARDEDTGIFRLPRS